MERKLPPLKALVAFEALARRGARADAARELNVTPGAIGKSVRLLEDWTGAALLVDGELTSAGRVLAASLSGGLDQILAGLSAVRPGRHRGELNLLAPATLALRWLVPHLPELSARDGLSIAVRPTHTGEDWQALPHDVVIRRDGWTPPGYRAEPLPRERLTLCVAPHLLADRPERPGDFVRRVPQLHVATRPGDAERWLIAAEAGGRLGQPSRGFGHLYIAYEAALAGEGWVVAPTVVIAEDVARGRLAAPFADIAVDGAALRMLSIDEPATAARTAPIRGWITTAFLASAASSAVRDLRR